MELGTVGYRNERAALVCACAHLHSAPSRRNRRRAKAALKDAGTNRCWRSGVMVLQTLTRVRALADRFANGGWLDIPGTGLPGWQTAPHCSIRWNCGGLWRWKVRGHRGPRCFNRRPHKQARALWYRRSMAPYCVRFSVAARENTICANYKH